MSNKLFITLSATLVGLTMFGIYYLASTLDAGQTAQDASDHGSYVSTRTASPQSTSKGNSQKSAEKPDSFDPVSSNKLSVLNLWFDLEDNTEISGVRLNTIIEVEKKIGVHTGFLAIVEEGNYIELPSINGHRYLLQLINKTRLTGDNYELSGKMHIAGKTYYSNLRISENEIFGMLETPAGEYNVRLANNKGYLYRANQLEMDDATGKGTDSITDIPGFLD